MLKEMDHDGHHLQLFFLPVGVMFCVDQPSPPPPSQQQYNNRPLLPSMDAVVDRRATTTSTNIVGGTTVGGVTATVQRRRQLSRISVGLRCRHNAILNLVTDWLTEEEGRGGGLSHVVRDQPLYKNKLWLGTENNVGGGGGDTTMAEVPLKRKSRAPDLMGVVMESDNDLRPSLVIVDCSC